jgi:hypothetical protein
MPQEINLNVSPYFDDFDADKNYQKVLFKPSFPVQARELTGLQSILQNQIEILGNQTFKEGSVVVPGEINYNNQFFAVEIDPEFLGIPIENYIDSLVGSTITGSSTNIKAKIIFVLNEIEERNTYTLYLNYLSSGNDGETTFSDSETLLLNETVNVNGLTIQESQGFANTISRNSSSVGSCVTISDGIYFIRGNFVNVYEQILILDSHSSNPSFRIGFEVAEEIVTSNEDGSLNDNAQGFNNFAAPGADRLKVSTFLGKRELVDNKNENFIELFVIENGKIKNFNRNFNPTKNEIERKVYETSGDFYINPFSIEVKETLNNLKGNTGVFLDSQVTYGNNTPSESLGTYKISPGKAIIKGSEVNIKNTTYVDFEKPRTTKTLVNQEISYSTGTSLSLNRSYGSPKIDLNNPFIVQLRSSRIGSDSSTPFGKEIGLARVYDYKLESNTYNVSNSNINQWEISLFDIQTYSDISLNEPLENLNVPTRIEGKKSGAIGFLRYEINQSGIITAYNITGSFINGEELEFDSINETRIITNIFDNNISNVKSIYGFDDELSLIFNADTSLTTNTFVGSATISRGSSGISTITSSSFIFTDEVKVGDIVSYSSPNLSIPSYASVIQVNSNNIIISSVTSVSGVCNGTLPTTTNFTVSDLKILTPILKISKSDKLYTFLPKSNISNINLDTSNLSVRKQYNIQILNGSSEIIQSGQDFSFLPFSENRYTLTRSNGVYEVLTPDKFTFSPDYKELQINGLGSNDINSRLIVTLKKENVKTIVKNKNKINSLLIDKSNNTFSGTGPTTINDGLVYGNYPYGTRIQDKEICLLSPEITKIYGIFESYTIENPELPSLILSEISTIQSTTTDLLLGEEIIGSDSGAVAILAEKISNSEIGIVYLNSNKFKKFETIIFKDTKFEASVSLIKNGSKDITDHYIFDFGSRDSIYDYSRLIRKSNYKNPTKKIKIVYENISVSPSESGDIVSVNSYDQFDYCEIPFVEGKQRSADIIDIRPRVSGWDIQENTRSPFEFLGRSFNTGSNTLASNESITLTYSYYLPRIDRIFLNSDGNIFVVNGVPSDNPELPLPINDSLEIANVFLSPYLCDINDISINSLEHKRFRMKDIHSLENRIKNLENYTTLSALELKTESLRILDSNGNDRFKSGFFVDDFKNTEKQINPEKNSIDIKKGELRPSYNTTEIDLILGSKSLLGIGTTSNSLVDFEFADDLIGSGVKRSGQILTLDYEDQIEIEQPFATRYENINSKLVRSYVGSIEIFPSSDTWATNTNKTLNVWNSWELNWTGVDISSNKWKNIKNISEIDSKVDRITFSSDEVFEDDYYIDINHSYKLREKNIEFTGNGFKPFTQVYAFFDGVDINKFITPKLIEINMLSGSFLIGETVVGKNESSEIKFRLSSPNHKSGPITNPTDTYTINPYNRNINIPSDYTSTSTILNLDAYSISYQPQGDFYGNIDSGMILRGLQSGAQAKVSDVKLVTDENGSITGSLHIPDYKLDINPSFDSGLKTLRLTSSSNNSSELNLTDTFAEKNYFSGGYVSVSNERITSVRTPIIENYKNLSPIAQSFIVSEDTGFFVTKIELFLKSKDTTLPLVVQLRTMSMGLPTDEIVPFSEIFVDPQNINISEDGSFPTEIKFESPVYLNPNSEFAIVVYSQSDEYSIWTSRIGEVDIITSSGIESQQILSTNSANVGSLYKSYNINLWSNIYNESLKFNLYKANFISDSGNINFFNPELNKGNNQVANLKNDSLEFNSRKLIIGLSTAIEENQITLGNTISQQLNNATGNYIGFGGSAFGNLGIVNAGIGYTPFTGSFTFNNIELGTLTGNGRNARASITIQNGVAIAATITNGGLGYLVGDTVTIPNGEIGITSLGRDIVFSISETSGINQLILDNVSGDFEISQNKQISYLNSENEELLLNSGGVYITLVDTLNQFSDGLHIKVNHQNHGMHFSQNSVLIDGVFSDLPPIRLESDYPFNTSTNIALSSTENFETFEGQPVGPNNPGYIIINGEIISYYGVVDNTLTNIERGIDQTNISTHFKDDLVQKYEICGISLRRVNKIHDLNYTTNSIGLDSYYIRIDMSSSDKGSILDNGPYGQVNRSVGNVYPKLYINETKSSGGSNIYASQNIQYEVIKPIVQTLILPGTNIVSSIKTTTGTSISGKEVSYIDSSFTEINIKSNNYLNTPRLVASKINEDRNLNGNKSLSLNLNLSTTNKNISPVIDLDRVGVILTTNRIDSMDNGNNAFEYITKNIKLKNPATALKVIMEAYVNVFSEIKVYYSVSANNSSDKIYYPFPGYDNLDTNNKVINSSRNSGLSDKLILKSDIICDQDLNYDNYEFTAENLPSFRYYSIKFVGKSKNQACPPRIRDFSVISLA